MRLASPLHPYNRSESNRPSVRRLARFGSRAFVLVRVTMMSLKEQGISIVLDVGADRDARTK